MLYVFRLLHWKLQKQCWRNLSPQYYSTHRSTKMWSPQVWYILDGIFHEIPWKFSPFRFFSQSLEVLIITLSFFQNGLANLGILHCSINNNHNHTHTKKIRILYECCSCTICLSFWIVHLCLSFPLFLPKMLCKNISYMGSGSQGICKWVNELEAAETVPVTILEFILEILWGWGMPETAHLLE